MKTWVEISRSALHHNVRALTRAAHPAHLIAVLKSNAYGHGLVPVAETIQKEVAWIGVDSIEEGSALRNAGIIKPILVIGYIPNEQLSICAEKQLSFVVYNHDSLKALKRLKKGRGAFRIHLPIETGTTREGIALKDLPETLSFIKTIPSVRVEGVYMHFADVDSAKKSPYAVEQLKNYQEALRVIYEWKIDPGIRHTSSSSAVFQLPEARFDLIRPGIALYGLWPSEVVRQHNPKTRLKPVLSWKTRVAQVKEVSKGTSVGYDRTESVKRLSRIAVLPVGYWDGYDRRLSSKGHVLIRGERCRIIGRICMNMCMVDVTDVPNAKLADEVVLIGTQKQRTITADEVAKTLKTIHYEVVTRINPQIPRVFVK